MATFLVRLSRAANRHITGETIMLCATAYDREWWYFVAVIDTCFKWKHTNHCHICWRYERRLAMTEDWEQSFLPLDDPRAVKPPSVVACAECTDLVHRDNAVIKQFHTGTITSVEYFCCDPCHHAWYVKRLRSWGM